MFWMAFGPRFGGIRPRPLRSFIILKKEREMQGVFGGTMGLGTEARPCLVFYQFKGGRLAWLGPRRDFF